MIVNSAMENGVLAGFEGVESLFDGGEPCFHFGANGAELLVDGFKFGVDETNQALGTSLQLGAQSIIGHLHLGAKAIKAGLHLGAKRFGVGFHLRANTVEAGSQVRTQIISALVDGVEFRANTVEAGSQVRTQIISALVDGVELTIKVACEGRQHHHQNAAEDPDEGPQLRPGYDEGRCHKSFLMLSDRLDMAQVSLRVK